MDGIPDTWMKFRWTNKWKKNTICTHEYIPLSDVTRRHLGILQLGNNESNTQYTHVCKNKVYIDLSLLFLLHVKDEDCDGSVGITLTTLVRKSEVST